VYVNHVSTFQCAGYTVEIKVSEEGGWRKEEGGRRREEEGEGLKKRVLF